MNSFDRERHDIVLLHVLYASLTRWIPLPLADQIAANIVRRQMVAKLAQTAGVTLEKPAQKALADEEIGCLYGCIFGILLFPIRLIVGKLFLLFRLKRFVDETSRQYHAARLLEYALRSGHLAPGSPHTPEQIRAAVNAVCASAPIGPVGAAFKHVLKKQTGVLKDIAALFTRSLRSLRGIRTEAKVQDAVQSAEAQARDQAISLLAPFRDALNDIPPEHFSRLEELFDAQLKQKR